MNIVVNPTRVSPVSGTNVTLTCVGSGITSASIVWKFYPTGSPSLATIIFKIGSYQNNLNSTITEGVTSGRKGIKY